MQGVAHDANYLLRMFLRHLLDLNAALARPNDYRRAFIAIHHYRQVIFVRDIRRRV